MNVLFYTGQGVRLAQWSSFAPPTSTTRVRILGSACWLRFVDINLTSKFFLRVLRFSSLSQKSTPSLFHLLWCCALRLQMGRKAASICVCVCNLCLCVIIAPFSLSCVLQIQLLSARRAISKAVTIINCRGGGTGGRGSLVLPQ